MTLICGPAYTKLLMLTRRRPLDWSTQRRPIAHPPLLWDGFRPAEDRPRHFGRWVRNDAVIAKSGIWHVDLLCAWSARACGIVSVYLLDPLAWLLSLALQGVGGAKDNISLSLSISHVLMM